MRVLVTGGAGFLGSHLCKRLASEGHVVVAVDNKVTSSQDAVDRLRDIGVDVVVGDVKDALAFGAAESHPDGPLSYDRVYHLACPASPFWYQRDPVDTAMTCALGAKNALDFAKRHGARVLLASTSEVYGDPEVHPQSEGYLGRVSTTGPRACYDEGKRFAETLFADYRRCHGVDARIARIFNTYGPGMRVDDGRVVTNFIQQAIRDHPITVYGDGTQTRSFCYVDDLIEGLIRLMEVDTSVEPPEPLDPVNLGNPGEFTILELAEMVIKMTGSTSEIVRRDLPVDDPARRRPDIGRALVLLGWEPSVDLREGLRRTIKWARLGAFHGGGVRPGW